MRRWLSLAPDTGMVVTELEQWFDKPEVGTTVPDLVTQNDGPDACPNCGVAGCLTSRACQTVCGSCHFLIESCGDL